MLTPEDIEALKPKFEEIRQLLDDAYIKSEHNISDEACAYYIKTLGLMEELVEEVTSKEGHSVKDVMSRLVSAEGAGVIGGVVSGAAVPAFFTGLGGFGVAAGGTAFGVAGLAGAAAATGGVGLAGAAAAYLAYKGGAAALETEMGQRATGQVSDVGSKAIDQAKSIGNKATEGFGRFRNRSSRSEPEDITND